MKKQMKRLLVGSLTLTLVSLGVIGCKKVVTEKVSQTPELQEVQKEKKYVDDNNYGELKIVNNTLEFSSIDYYESFFSSTNKAKVDFLINYIEEQNFNSLKKSELKKDVKEDNFIETILDENQIVKIGKWHIRLNFDSKKVFVCSSENKESYKLVLDENVDSGKVYEFSFEDEVLEYLKDEDSLIQKKWFKRCKERKAKSKYDKTNIHRIFDYNGIYIEAELESKYRRYGIYFTLVSNGILASNDFNFDSNIELWFYLSNCSYKVRCNYAVNHYTYPTRYPTNMSVSNASSQRKIDATFRWYAGVQQLKYYDYRVKLRVDHTYFATPPNYFTDVYSNWTYISDY
jgi:hypothetical protein